MNLWAAVDDSSTATIGPDFWAAVGLAAALATAFATVITVVISLWWRRVDQARPVWVLSDGESLWTSSDCQDAVPPRAVGKIANAGTGAGYRLAVVGMGCHAHLWERLGPTSANYSYLPVAASGLSLHLTVHCEPADWDQAQIAVMWEVPSLWRTTNQKRIEVRSLSDFAGRPAYAKITEDTQSGVLKTVLEAEPTGPALPDELAAQTPLPSGNWLQQRAARRHLLATR